MQKQKQENASLKASNDNHIYINEKLNKALQKTMQQLEKKKKKEAKKDIEVLAIESPFIEEPFKENIKPCFADDPTVKQASFTEDA